MNGTSLGESLFHGRLRTSSNRLRWLGIAMVILGVAAILFPIFSTLVAGIVDRRFKLEYELYATSA